MILPPLSIPVSWQKKLDNHRILAYRLVIIPFVLLASIVFAIKLEPPQSYAVIALPFLVVGLLLLLRWPPIGLLGLVGASLMVTYYPPLVSLPALILIPLTGLWVFDMMVRQRNIAIIRARSIYALAAFLAVSIIAFIVGQLPWYPITPAPLDGQIGGLAIFIVSICAFLLVAHQVDDIRWLKAILFLYLLIGGVYLIGRLIPTIGTVNARFFAPAAAGGMFWVWLTSMAFAQGLYNKELHPLWRGVFFLMTGMALYIGMFQLRAWTSGWLPAVVAIMVVLLTGKFRQGLIVVILGAFVILTQAQLVLDTFINVGDNAYSQLTRLEAWRIIGEIVKVNPILGLGPANYRFYTPLFPILGWQVQFNSHNNYVDLIAQTGILGLLLILWFFWEVWQMGWRLRHPVGEGTFAQAYVYGVMGGLVGAAVSAMLGDWVLPYVYNITIEGLRASIFAWLFWGGLLAIEQHMHPSATEN